MIRNNKKTINNYTIQLFSSLIIFLLLSSLSLIAHAHSLKETSARITLRDGQVEVRLYLDMNRWQSRLQDNQAWLVGDISTVMPVGLTPKQAKSFIENVLLKESSLMINNQAIPLTLQVISATKNINNHHDYTEVVLTAKHTFSVVEHLNIGFPKSLGAVHASFVKPQYKLVSAGKSAQISFSPQNIKAPKVTKHSLTHSH